MDPTSDPSPSVRLNLLNVLQPPPPKKKTAPTARAQVSNYRSPRSIVYTPTITGSQGGMRNRYICKYMKREDSMSPGYWLLIRAVFQKVMWRSVRKETSVRGCKSTRCTLQFFKAINVNYLSSTYGEGKEGKAVDVFSGIHWVILLNTR